MSDSDVLIAKAFKWLLAEVNKGRPRGEVEAEVVKKFRIKLADLLDFEKRVSETARGFHEGDEGAGTSGATGGEGGEEVIMDMTEEELRERLLQMGVKNLDSISNDLLNKIYVEMLTENIDIDLVKEWDLRIKSELGKKAEVDIRAYSMTPAGGNLKDGFIDQLNHFLKLCGLERHQWGTIVRMVVYDVSDSYKDMVKKMVFACRYIGFDPSVILKKLIRSHREGQRQPKVTYTLQYTDDDGEESSWIFTNQEDLDKDMTFLIITFLQRGAVINKIAKKSPKDFAGLLRMLVAKYNIRLTEEGDRTRRAEALGPEIVTLPRIAACLAQLTTSLYHAGFGRAIANFSEFGNCPDAMFSPMFASVVRKAYKRNNIRYNIHPQLVLIAILIDNVLHLRDKVTSLDQIWTYYLASYQSKVVIDTARIQQCRIFGVCNEQDDYAENILALREHCKNRIRELRPHERIEDFMREMDEVM